MSDYPRITLAVKALTPIVAVAGILVGLHKFQKGEENARERDREQTRLTDDIAYRRALWEKRRDTYAAIGDVVGQLAASVGDAPAFDAAVKRFDALYWGGMVLVEDKLVATAMIRLHEEIVLFRDNRSNGDRIKERAFAVGTACRDSLARYQPEDKKD